MRSASQSIVRRVVLTLILEIPDWRFHFLSRPAKKHKIIIAFCGGQRASMIGCENGSNAVFAACIDSRSFVVLLRYKC